MSGEDLLQHLAALTPEQRKLPVEYEYYTWGDEHEMNRFGEIVSIRVEKKFHCEPGVIIKLSADLPAS